VLRLAIGMVGSAPNGFSFNLYAMVPGFT